MTVADNGFSRTSDIVPLRSLNTRTTRTARPSQQQPRRRHKPRLRDPPPNRLLIVRQRSRPTQRRQTARQKGHLPRSPSGVEGKQGL